MTEFQSGDVVDGRYALDLRIGLGGMAAVWRARDVEGGGVVAVKILREDFLRRNPKEAENNVRRFRREAEILKMLSGARHVVQVRGDGATPDGDPYIVMELLEGEPLRAKIRRGRQAMGVRTFAWLARGLVRGLGEIHAKGVIHRDLSPDNVFVTKDAEGLPCPKFLDFGIGKGAAGQFDQVTQLVTIMGKPQYFSPEQARGGELTPASDVYSLGVILYEMATGATPIDLHGVPLVQAVKRIVSEPPLDLAAVPEGARLPESLRAVIMKALAKKPDERAKIEEIARELDAFTARLDRGEEFGTPGTERPGSPVTPVDPTPVTVAEPPSPAPFYREFKAGDELGRFQIKRRVGKGGMGEVYRAWDTVLHRDVAIKVVSKVEGEKAQRAVLREARASSRLRSGNIVTVYDAGVHSGLPYIVMEYVEGRTLAEVIEEDGPLVGDRFWAYARGLCDGLAFAHESDPKVVHKDLKPGNILCAGDVAKIADFGIASLAATAGAKGESQMAGAAHGSVHIMSPEQAEGGRPVDERSDIYSLGCVFYMMTTGAPPFDGNEIAVLYQHQTQTPEAPSKRNPAFAPPELEPVILKCLKKKPEDRYATVRELRAELERLFQPSTATMLRPWHRRTPVLLAILALLAAAALFLLWLKAQSGAVRDFGVEVAGRSVDSEGADVAVPPSPNGASAFAMSVRAGSSGTLRVLAVGPTKESTETAFEVKAGDAKSNQIEVPLPPTPDDGAELVRYEVQAWRDDRPEKRLSFVVTVDRAPPTLALSVYGKPVDLDGGPLRVVSFDDVKATLKDAGGLRVDRDSTATELPLPLTQTVTHTAYSTRPAPSGDVLRVEVDMTDAQGNRRTREVVLERMPVAAVAEQPAKDAAFTGPELPLTWRLAPAAALDGLDAATFAEDLTARLRSTDRVGEPGPFATPQLGADGRFTARLPLPRRPGAAYVVEVELVRKGEPLRLTEPLRFRYDGAPPTLSVPGRLDADQPAAPATQAAPAVVALRSNDAARDAISVEVAEAESPSKTTVEFAAGDAPPRPMVQDAHGRWHPPDDFRPEGDVTLAITARDEAGNTARAWVRLERRAYAVVSAELDGLPLSAPGASRPADADAPAAWTNRRKASLTIVADNVDPQESLRVRVTEGRAERGGAAVEQPMTRGPDGRTWRAEVDLVLAAPKYRRFLTVSVLRPGSPPDDLRTWAIAVDQDLPVLKLSLADGTPLACGERHVFPAPPTLRISAHDAGALAPESFVAQASGAVVGDLDVVDAEAIARSVTLEAPKGADVVAKLTASAKDAAGNAAEPCAVDLVVVARPARILAFDGAPEYGTDGARAGAVKPVRHEAFTLNVARHPDLKGYDLVAISTLETADGVPKRNERDAEATFVLAGAGGQGQEFPLTLPVPADCRAATGTTRFFLKDLRSDRLLESPALHEVRWRLDRRAPEVTVTRRGARLSAESMAAGIRVGDLSEIAVECVDEGGFASPAADAYPGFVVETAADAGRLVLRPKADAAFVDGAERTLELEVRDAAGNAARRTLRLIKARAAPMVSAITARVEGRSAAVADPDGETSWFAGGDLDLEVTNEAPDAVGFDVSATSDAGVVVDAPFTAFDAATSKGTARLRLPPGDGAWTATFTHFTAAGGRQPKPFATRKLRIDGTAPTLTVSRRGGGAPIARVGPDEWDAGEVKDLAELEFVAEDAGVGVTGSTIFASLTAENGAFGRVEKEKLPATAKRIAFPVQAPAAAPAGACVLTVS
ncbi:MAG TPA: serine/threonine-protein kinase, partial [Planctomycetota bacterium]|nr:serine/threonine-protein kinase [Planctomycetota bacterium]